MSEQLTVSYWSDDVLCSRSVSNDLFTGEISIACLPARLISDWEREISQHLALEPGDVEALPLARARMRWPDYKHSLDAAIQWAQSIGIGDALVASSPALMACRGARYHHDGDEYGGKAFCNLFLSEDKGLDVHFPAVNKRIPLTRGTILLFDPCQTHGVIDRVRSGFNSDAFRALVRAGR
jgi:hypothetical protein